jgi:hypothetical protein
MPEAKLRRVSTQFLNKGKREMGLRTVNGCFKLLAFIGLALIASQPARADFSGAYAPANWTTSLAGTPPGGGGSVDTSGAPASITLNGGDAGCSAGPCTLQYTITAPGSGPLTFDWNYSTTDVDGPGLDLFLVVNGAATTQLSDNAGGTTQNGSENITITAGDTVGFMINCTDCGLGPANVTISNFNGPAASAAPTSIPTLSEWGMIVLSTLLALGTILTLRRQRQ